MDNLKELVANENRRIELHDRIASNLQKLFEEFDGEVFSEEKQYSQEEFEKRIHKCEELVEELCTIHALLGFWGTDQHANLQTFALENITYQLKEQRGNRAWIAAKWHAVHLIFFYAGLAATARNDYHLLFRLFNTKIVGTDSSETKVTIPEALLYVNSDLDREFDNLIEQTNHKIPLRQYTFNQIKKDMQDIIYLGDRFEDVYYRFEIVFALEYINRRFDEIGDNIWGPVGLFGFKQYRYNPYKEFIEESQQKKEDWDLIQAGFFNGDYDRFQKIYTSFQDNVHRFRW